MTEHKLVDRISLGATGIQISPLGIGTWAWGDTWFWQYGKGGYSDADLEAAYQASLAYGISFFDTAEMYGRPFGAAVGPVCPSGYRQRRRARLAVGRF